MSEEAGTGRSSARFVAWGYAFDSQDRETATFVVFLECDPAARLDSVSLFNIQNHFSSAGSLTPVIPNQLQGSCGDLETLLAMPLNANTSLCKDVVNLLAGSKRLWFNELPRCR